MISTPTTRYTVGTVTARSAAATAAGLLLIGVAGCSSSSSGSSNAAHTSANAALCSSVGALNTSLHQLTGANLKQEGLSGVKSSVATIESGVATVVKDAKNHYSSEIDAEKHDAASLKSALQIAKENPSYPTIAQVGTEAKTLLQSVGGLKAKLASSC